MNLSIDGLASGLDTTALINQILGLERRPIFLIQNQVESAQNKQSAYLDLSARLLSLQISANRLSDPNFFRSVQVESGNSELLTVSAGSGTPPGSYSFRVAQTARASQFTSSGFAANDSLVGAGTLTLEQGGFVDVDTDLESLNGGQGVSRGTIRITDAAGESALIDLSIAIDIDDVIAAIGNAEIGVTARISDSGRGITLEDESGGIGTLQVEDLDGRSTALDLGIRGTAVGTSLVGSEVLRLGESTQLASLRDGLGIRGTSGDDLVITRRDGSIQNLDIGSATTVQGLIDAFSAIDPNLVLSVNAAGDGFDLADTGTGTGLLKVASSANSFAALDLGIETSDASGTIQGRAIYAGINDQLLSNLNGGGGITAGSIEITDRNGVATTVDLSTAQTLGDVIRAIEASGAAVTATTNRVGNGLRLIDNSGGTGTLEVAESGGGTTALDLGLLGSSTTNELSGTDLNPRYVDENTRLDSLNGGNGVSAGSIRITDSDGFSFTVDLAQEETIADVILDIKGAGASSNLTDVRVNDAGNGLLIEGPAGITELRIEEVNGGTTARDLGIVGTADGSGNIDGSFERTITIDADDTLQDVLTKIADLGIGVSASILNDGSSGSPFRLSVVGRGTGRDSRLQVDAGGATALSFQQTATARDGILFYGEDSDGSSSLMIRSSTNSYENIVEGMTVTARGTSDAPIAVNVTEDRAAIADQMGELITALNGVLDTIGDLTAFNADTEEAGILLGDSTVRGVQRSLVRALTRPIVGVDNAFSTMSELGVRFRGGQFQFDRGDFEAALAEDPDAVERFFGAARGISETTSLDDFGNGEGVRTKLNENDMRVTLRDGTDIEINLDGSSTVQDVINAINAAGAGSLTAELSLDGRSFVLRDATTGTSDFRATSINASGSANDLGIADSADTDGGGVITGTPIDLTQDPGIASRLNDAIVGLTDATDGVLQRRANGLDELIDSLNDRVARIEERLVNREELLRRQFTNLEQIMAQSQATMDRLNATLTGLRR